MRAEGHKLVPTKCTSFWGHSWLTQESGDPLPEQRKHRICRRCGLIQQIDYFMYPDGVWIDEGYISLEKMLTQLTSEKEAS